MSATLTPPAKTPRTRKPKSVPDPELWTKAEMLVAIETKYTRHDFVKVIQVIQDRQTRAEQMADQTNETNGVGWNKFDAEIMGKFLASAASFNGSLSPRMFETAKRILKKYAGQLVDAANAKIVAKRAQFAADEQAADAASVRPEPTMHHIKVQTPWTMHVDTTRLHLDNAVTVSCEASDLPRTMRNIPHPFDVGQTIDVTRFAEETDREGEVTHWWIDERFQNGNVRQLVRITIYND